MTLADRLRLLLEAMPPGGSVTIPRDAVAEWLEQDMESLQDAPPAAPPLVEGDATWRTMLWTVPAETRLGVSDLAEALGRSKSWLYKRTGPKADSPIPHRRLDGELTFVAGEIRTWLRTREEVVHALPMAPPSLRVR